MWLSGDCILLFTYVCFWRPNASNYTCGWVKKTLNLLGDFFRLQSDCIGPEWEATNLQLIAVWLKVPAVTLMVGSNL